MVKKQQDLREIPEASQYHAAAYAGRYTTEPIPKFRLPEGTTPATAAYRLIHDEVAIDGRPAQNLATFCTTWMEPEADRLIAEGIHYNLADEDEYPHVIQLEERCVNMLANLFHAPISEGGARGTATIGSSEAIMLAGLAMKFNWRARRQAAGKSADQPNLIMGANVQICWKKFARYFDVTPRYLPLEPGRYVVTPEQVANAADENTIGVCTVLGSTFTGEFEPVAAIGDALTHLNAENGWDIPIHVDAASGGFIAPFLYPDLEWDFRVPLVRSINVSGHKYGLCYPGIGWVIWREPQTLHQDLIFKVNYLGGEMETFNLNFSRPASGMLSQYYNFIRFGRAGYTDILKGLKANADYLRAGIEATGRFDILSNDHGVPLIAWACKPDDPFTAYDLSHKLRQRGWIVPAYSMPHNAETVICMRAVVREGMSRDLCDALLDDLQWALGEVERMTPKPAAGLVEAPKDPGIC
jgi:glutamate decarboxylase